MAGREKEIFHEVCALAAPDRATLLERLRTEDPTLHARLETLLRAADEAGDFLRGKTTALSNQPREHVEGYHIEARLGEGGFSEVYRAEQLHPVRRIVALKILKRGMDTRAVVARFEAERQALAMMEHVNIARVFDGGATAAGRPFFVMELVKGTPITTFCNDRHLDLEERLRLFIQVCHAVQHAHHKGVVHRDLKPSNILVSFEENTALAKVIDFGIAKATREPLTDHTQVSRLHLFVGTPAYMSPEQIALGGADIDTRADIYSLGALLYELLASEPPFEARKLAELSYPDLERTLREVEPPPPSQRVAGFDLKRALVVANKRQTVPTRLRATLRGDLDHITLKCLEKNREHRYDTATALARDLERYLGHEPVRATRSTWRYRAGKFLRRYHRSVWVVGAVAVLLGGLAIYHTRRLASERDRARFEAEKARKISELLTEVLSSPDPFRRSVGAATSPAMLSESVARARRELARQPDLLAEILNAVGRVQLRSGHHAEAQALLAEALVAGRESGERNDRLAQTLNDLGVLYRERGDFRGSARFLDEAVSIRRDRVEADPNALAASQVELGRVCMVLEQLPEAEKLFREALSLRQRALGEHSETATSLGDVGFLLWQKGDLVAAEKFFQEALAMDIRTLGANHPNSAQCMAFIALVRSEQGNLPAAEQLLLGALAKMQSGLGENHWRAARLQVQLAGVLRAGHRLAEAEALAGQGREIIRTNVGANSLLTIQASLELAQIFIEENRFVEAESLLREVLALQLKMLPLEGWQVASTQGLLGGVCWELGHASEAETLLVAADRILRPVAGPQGRQTAATQAWLAKVKRAKSSD